MNKDTYTIYEGTAPYLFISYSHQDNQQVEPIIRRLQGMGYRVWYDTGITIGGRWPDIIAEHVMKSSCVVAFLSRNAIASDYCQEEIFFALEEHRPIIPVYLEELELPPGLRMRLNIRQAIHRTNFRSDAEFLTKLTNETYVKPSFGGQPQEKKPQHPTFPDNDTFLDDDIDLFFTNVESRQWQPPAEPVIEYDDHLLIPAVDIIMETKAPSVSLLQRRLKIGYARSAEIIDEIEALGIIGPFSGTSPRRILITPERWDTMKNSMKLAE